MIGHDDTFSKAVFASPILAELVRSEFDAFVCLPTFTATNVVRPFYSMGDYAFDCTQKAGCTA